MEKNLTIDMKWVYEQRRQGLDDGQIATKLGMTKDAFKAATGAQEAPQEILVNEQSDIVINKPAEEEKPVSGARSYVPEDVIEPRKESQSKKQKYERGKRIETKPVDEAVPEFDPFPSYDMTEGFDGADD